MKTPYEKFKSLPNASDYLKPTVTFEQLDAQAAKMSDNDAALAMNNAIGNLARQGNSSTTPCLLLYYGRTRAGCIWRSYLICLTVK